MSSQLGSGREGSECHEGSWGRLCAVPTLSVEWDADISSARVQCETRPRSARETAPRGGWDHHRQHIF